MIRLAIPFAMHASLANTQTIKRINALFVLQAIIKTGRVSPTAKAVLVVSINLLQWQINQNLVFFVREDFIKNLKLHYLATVAPLEGTPIHLQLLRAKGVLKECLIHIPVMVGDVHQQELGFSAMSGEGRSQSRVQ